MESNLKNLTVGEEQVTPIVPEVQNIRTLETFVPENPFKELNFDKLTFDKLTSTSQPQYKLIGLSDAAIDRGMALGKQKLQQDPFIQAQRFEAPAVPGFQSALQSDYFQDIGVIPGMDIEETYGSAQTNWNKLSNAIMGSGSLALNQMKDQFLSWGDTINMFKGDSPFKQSELEAINEWQNDFNNKYHIFQTQEDRNTFWNVSNFANTIQQSGYAIGAFLEVAAEEFALSALTAATFGGASEIQAARSIQLASKLGKVINNTRNLEKSLQSTNVLRKIFNNSVTKFVNPLQNTAEYITDFSKVARIDQRAFGQGVGALRTTARGFGAFYRDLRMLNAGITEAKATVAPVMNEAYETAIEEYKNINGFEPSEELKTKLKQKAFETVQTEGAVQAAWIALTDKIAFDGILRTFKGTRFLDDDLVAKGIFTNTKKTIKEGGDLFVAKKGVAAFTHQLKTSPFKTLIKFPLEYAKTNVVEGLQETGQDVIDSATKQWYLYNYGTEQQRLNQKGINDFLYAGAKEQLTMDGLKTFMSGFLTGGILNVLGGGIKGAKSLYDKTVNTDGYKSSVQRANEERNKLVALLNQSTNNKTDFYRSLVELDSSMRLNGKEGRKKEYWDSKNDFINKYVLNIVKSGMEDVIIDRMKESISDLNPDEFKQAYAGSLYDGLSEEQSKNVMTGLVSTFESKVKEVKDTYEKIRENYGNPYNPKQYKIGTPEYNAEVANYMAAEEAINQMAFSKSTYLDVAKRQKEILTNIKNNFPNLNFNSLYSLTSPSITLKKELELLQKEFEATSDPKLKEEKKQKLDLFNKYKESVEKYSAQIEEAGDNVDEIKKIKVEFLKENSQAISEILKLDNPDVSVITTTDVINNAVGDIFDYLRLQTDFEDAVSYFNTIANPAGFEGLHQAHLGEIMEMMGDTKMYEDAGKDYIEKNPKNNKHFVLRLKNKYVLFSPKGTYVDKFETIEEANSIAEQLDEIYDENANRITIDVLDINGEPSSIQIVENNFYLTEDKKLKKSKYTKNIIKIVSIEGNNITYQLNYQPTLEIKTAEEFANEFGLLKNFKNLDLFERFFYVNRDKQFRIKVNKKYSKPHRLDENDYTDTSVSVDAALVGEYTEDGVFKLYMQYKNPNSKSKMKVIKVPFNLKYYEKYALKKQPSGFGLIIDSINKEILLQEAEKQNVQEFEDQQSALVNLINRVEEKLEETKAKKESNSKRLQDLQAELELFQEELASAQDYIEKNPPSKTGRKKAEYIKMKEKINSFPNAIQSIESTIANLNEELEDLNTLNESLVEARNNYYNALDEIEKTKEVFQTDETGTIYGEAESRLEDYRKELITKRYSKEQVDKLVEDTEFEIEELKEIVLNFEKLAEQYKDIWKKLSKYMDVAEILLNVDDRKQLANYLKQEERSATDPEAIEFLKQLRKSVINKTPDIFIAKEIAQAYQDAKNAFDKINNELYPKLQRLQQASAQLGELSTLQERVDFLKYIQNELFEEVGYIKERRRIQFETTTAERAKNAKLNPDANIVEVVNGDDLFVSEDGFKRPLIGLTGLYLTTGRHYIDKNDTEINQESGNARFFKFTDNVNVEGGEYFLMPVTRANDPYNITIDENDIKVVVVRKEGENYFPVDIVGNKIDNPTSDNIVYTSLRMNQEQLFGDISSAVEWVEETFTTKGVTKEQITNMIFKYRDFVKNIRATVSENADMYIPITGKTVGQQVMLPMGENGLPQELELQGRVIEENTTDFANLRHPNGQGIKLKVATDKSDGIKPGRLYMKRDDGQIFRLFNRQLTQEEKDNFISLLKYYAKIYQKEKVEKLTTDEEANKNLILSYFKGLVFWTTDDNVIESENKFYINQTGMLYRGRTPYDLNPSIIEENKEDIVSELRHQVNNSLLTKTNIPFYVPVVDKDNNVIIDAEYSNYTEYLFKTSTPVVYTNTPLYSETDVNTPQVKSSNLTYRNVDDDFKPIINYKNQSAVTIPGVGGAAIQLVPGQIPIFKFGTATDVSSIEKETAQPEIKQNTNPESITLIPGQIPTFSFKTESQPVAEQVSKNINAETEPISIGKRLEQIQAQGIFVEPVSPEQPKPLSESEKEEALKAFNQSGGVNILSAGLGGVKPNEAYRLQLEQSVIQTEDFKKVEEWFKSKLPNIKVVKVAELIDGKAWGAFKNSIVYIYENAEIGTGFHEAFEAVWNAYLTVQEQNEFVEEFRNREGRFTNPFSKETKNYSEASHYDVREMLAEEFRNYILSEQEQISTEEKGFFGKIKQFFKELWSTIKKYVGLSKKEKSEGESAINKLFNKINAGNYSNVRFARDISEMGTSYREVVPNTTQEFTTQFIDGLSSYFFQNLHNPNLFTDNKGNFISLNIESLLTEDENNNKILRKLFETSMSNIYEQLFGQGSIFFTNYFAPTFINYQKQIGRNLTVEENNEIKNIAYNKFSEKNRYASMIENAFQNSTIVYNILKQSLQKYGLQFAEVKDGAEEDSAPNELDVVDTSGIRDTIYIDPRRLTATSFKILIGSLTKDIYDSKTNQIYTKKNSLNLPELVDYDATLNLLLNELNGTYSKLEVDQNGEVLFVDALKAMFKKLDEKYFDKKVNQYKPNFVWINKLKKRLKYSGEAINYFTKENINIDDLKLLIGFEKSLMNKKNIPSKLIINEDSSIYLMNALESTNEDRIREEWQGELPRNLKLVTDKEENNNQLLGIDDTGNIVFDKKSVQYREFLKLKNNNDKNISIQTALLYLKDMGVAFTGVEYKENKTISDIPLNIINKRSDVISSFIKIKNSIISNEENSIINIADLYSNIGPESGNMKKLIDIEKIMRYDSSVLTHTTASGETQYSITLPASINYVLSSLNESKTLADFVASNPQFGTVGYDENGEQVVNVFAYQTNSQLLKPGGLIFDENGNKKNNIDYTLISGVTSMDTNGVDTANLTYPDRIMQEINYILNADKEGLKPIYFTIINSDKSSEFGLTFSKPFISARIAEYDIDNPNFNKVLDIYLQHLEDEIDAAIVEKALKSNIQYYSENVKYLGHFKDVLKFKTEKELKKSGERKSGLQVRFENLLAGKITKEEFLADNVIKELIKNDLKETVNFTIDALIELGIINQITEDQFTTDAINTQVLNDYFQIDSSNITRNQLEKLVKYITINKELAVTEQHKLLYGHPALYKDLAKRANGINSSKDAIVDNPYIISKMDSLIPRFDEKIRASEKIQTFKNISFKDVTAVSNFYKQIAENLYKSILLDGISLTEAQNRVGANFNEDGTFKNFILKDGKFTGEIKAYVELNEADGQGWIMSDMYRDMLFLSGKLSQKQLDQIDYEIAYEVVARSNKSKTDPAYKTYNKGKYTVKWAEGILKKGNPNVPLPVIKPQYFGYAVNTSMMHTVFLKHSVQPKFYRSVEGTEYEKLYLAAQNNQIDVIGFESGEKVGAMLNPKTGEFVSIIKNDGAVNIELKNKQWQLPSGLPVQSLYTKFYGIQSEQPAIYKNKVVRGTQITKLIMSNFKVNGKYINDRAEVLITNYNRLIENIVKKGKEQLLVELGITKEQDGSYTVNDYTNMINLLRKELTKRDLPSNLVDALDVNPNTKGLLYRFDTLANRDKIDNILNSIMDSRVISAKMFGKPAVQVAFTGYNSTNRTMMYLKDGVYTEMKPDDQLTEDETKSLIPTSSDLKFYELKDGKISKMEIYIPWYFENVEPEDFGMKLVNGVYQIPANMDKRLLNMIGFRIPTQGMNSIENIVVKGFLPRESGDMIVVPTEIVGKAGSDFDIDKMNLYIPNYKLKYTRFTKETINDFKSTDYYKDLPKTVKNKIKNLTEEEFKDMVEDLNQFSAGSGLGKFGDLEDYLVAQNITGEDYIFYTTFKDALIKYNKYRKDVIKNNRINNKAFTPIIESIEYVEIGQDSMESLQNELRETMEELISMPENYRQLIMPNSTATLKSLANEINDLKGKKDAENSMLALRKFIQSAETRERYLTGKRLVGIAALQSTSHIMSQISDIVLSGKYEVSKMKFLVKYDPEFKTEDGKYVKAISINLSHNESKLGEFYINAKTDAEGRWISENISEALSGFVDAAKDPFVFSLNINFNTAGTWFYLQKLGVPMKEIAYLFNQPAVENFMKSENMNNSIFRKVNKNVTFREQIFINSISKYVKIYNNEMFSVIDQINEKTNILNTTESLNEQEVINLRVEIKALKEKLFQGINEIKNKYKKPTVDELKNAIKNLNNPKYKITEDDAAMQIMLLTDYLDYVEQSSYLTEFIGAIGYDNKKTKTIIENQLQLIRWNRMLEAGFIKNPDSILDKTFIGEMKKQKEDLFSVFENMFISLDRRAYPVFEKMYEFLEDREKFISNDDKSLLINKYQRFFITYVIQNTNFKLGEIETNISAKFKELMMGENSITKQLQLLKNSEDYNISQNLAIKELIPIFANNVDDQDNIKLFRNKMTTFKNDVLIESINNLLDYAKASGNTQLENFVYNLSIFSILQSGLQDSTINYTKILPAHLYSQVVNSILDVYMNSEFTIDPNLVWKQFHQNNKSDRNIVIRPQFKKFEKYTGNVLLDTDYSDSNYEYIATSKRKNGITDSQIEKLKKFGKLYKAFDTYLHQRIGYKTIQGKFKEREYAIYSPIVASGDGRNYTETSMENQLQSNLKKNNIVTPEGYKKPSQYEETPSISSLASVPAVTQDTLRNLQEATQAAIQTLQQLNPQAAATILNQSMVQPSTQIKPRTIAIIGTAGRSQVPTLNEWNNMIADAESKVNNYDTLISGGAAFADHIAVRLFLDGKVNGLKLKLPAKIKNGKFVGERGTAGGTANYYHSIFSKLLGVNTISEIEEAIEKGADVTYESEISNKAMFIRNEKVAKESDSMIAYTYGKGNVPADGGTKNTWDLAKYSDKIHVNIGSITKQTITKPVEEKTLKLMDGNAYPISQINSQLLESIGYTPLQIGNILKSIC
jgi:hypothetical protein